MHRLVMTWGLLMALTLLAGLAARVSGTARPGTLGLVALAVVTCLKARLILARYLRLDVTPALLSGFTAAVVIVVGLVTLSFVVPLARM